MFWCLQPESKHNINTSIRWLRIMTMLASLYSKNYDKVEMEAACCCVRMRIIYGCLPWSTTHVSIWKGWLLFNETLAMLNNCEKFSYWMRKRFASIPNFSQVFDNSFFNYLEVIFKILKCLVLDHDGFFPPGCWLSKQSIFPSTCQEDFVCRFL